MKLFVVLLTLFTMISCTKSDLEVENEQGQSVELSFKDKKGKRYTGNKIGDDEFTLNFGFFKWVRKRVVCDRKDKSSCIEGSGDAGKTVFTTKDGTFEGELMDESSEDVDGGVRYNFDFKAETYKSSTFD